MMISEAAALAAQQHALQCYPNESCGVILNGAYHPVENVAKDPSQHFEMARYPVGLEAVIHSHPGELKAVPSKADMEAQIASALPWAIIGTDGVNCTRLQWFGDQVDPLPLIDENGIGRAFIEGVQDCYSGLRDYFRTPQPLMPQIILLPEFPREPEWWYNEAEPDMLTPENFERAGFRQISPSEVRENDVLLMAVRCARVNHCGIYVGGGLVQHHLYGRPYRREPLGPWLKTVRYTLRHRDLE